MKNKSAYIITAFILTGLIGGFFLISQDEPHKPERTYDFVEYTQAPNILVFGSGKKIQLWGINTKSETLSDNLSKKIEYMVSEQNVSYVIVNKMQTASAKVFLSDGTDVSQKLINEGLVTENCTETKGIYGTCN